MFTVALGKKSEFPYMFSLVVLLNFVQRQKYTNKYIKKKNNNKGNNK